MKLGCWLVEFAFKVLLPKSPSWSPAGRRRLWYSSPVVHPAVAERAKKRAEAEKPGQESSPGSRKAARTLQSDLEKEKENSIGK